MTNTPGKLVDAEILRRWFNDGKFIEKAEAGIYKTVLGRDSHAKPKPNIPWCSRSQTIYYYDESNTKLALAHQYVLPTGEIGASGKPDPKVM